MKINLKNLTNKGISRGEWISHEEAFKLLEMGPRYRLAHGKKYPSYEWLAFLKKLSGKHPFSNFHQSHVRRYGKKMIRVLFQKVGFEIIYPKFVETEEARKLVA